MLDRLRADDRRGAVALGAQLDAAVAGDDGKGARRRRERRQRRRAGRCRARRAVGSRSSLVETIGRAMENRRAISSGVPSMPGAVVLDEVALAIGQVAKLDRGAGVEAVVGQLLQHEAAELVLAARRPAAAGLRRCGTGDQSSRSNFKFETAGELAKAGSGF